MYKEIIMQRFPNEKNDCAVLAIATLEGIAYTQAYEKLFSAGRKFRHGTYIASYANTHGYVERPLVGGVSGSERLHLTLRDVANIWNKGKFLICNRNHAMALIDGVVHNIGEPPWRSEVVSVYELEAKK